MRSGPSAKHLLAFARFGHLVQPIDGPGQAEGPVRVVHGRRLVDPIALDELIDAYENKIGPRSRYLELRMLESTTSERDWRKPTEPRKRTCDRFAT